MTASIRVKLELQNLDNMTNLNKKVVLHSDSLDAICQELRGKDSELSDVQLAAIANTIEAQI